MTESAIPDDPEQTRQTFINAAANADAVRIAYLAQAVTAGGKPIFTRDDLLLQWIGTWPHHQYPPFKRRPAQRLPLAYPIVMATGILVPVDDDPELREVQWPVALNWLASRIGLAVQLENISVFATALDVDTPTVQQIDAIVAELSRVRANPAADLVLTVQAEVIKGGQP